MVVVVVMIIVVVRVSRGNGRECEGASASAQFSEQHGRPDCHERQRGDDRNRADHHVGRQERFRAGDEQGKEQDSEGVGNGDREAEARRVPNGAAGPDEVGRHERLAVARRERVARAEGHRQQNRQDGNQRREVRPKQIRDVARYAAWNGRRTRGGRWRGGRCNTRFAG